MRATPAAVQAVARRLERLPEHYSEALLRALDETDSPDSLDEGVWGEAPTAEQHLAATIRNEARLAANREQVLAQSLSRREAAARLRVTPQQISKLVDAGELVALTGRQRQLALPRWQFVADTSRGRLEGIAALQRTFPGGPVSLTQWVGRANPALGGTTPVELLAVGALDRVLVAAEAAA